MLYEDYMVILHGLYTDCSLICVKPCKGKKRLSAVAGSLFYIALYTFVITKMVLTCFYFGKGCNHCFFLGFDLGYNLSSLFCASSLHLVNSFI